MLHYREFRAMETRPKLGKQPVLTPFASSGRGVCERDGREVLARVWPEEQRRVSRLLLQSCDQLLHFLLGMPGAQYFPRSKHSCRPSPHHLHIRPHSAVEIYVIAKLPKGPKSRSLKEFMCSIRAILPPVHHGHSIMNIHSTR